MAEPLSMKDASCEALLDLMIKESKTGCAIISVPEMVLLKANQMMLDYLLPRYSSLSSCIGKKITRLTSGYSWAPSPSRWKELLNKPEIYVVKEYKSDAVSQQATYWDITIKPVFVSENLEYFYITSEDVTEKIILSKNRAKSSHFRFMDRDEIFSLLSHISHEFKTPLTVILSALQAIDYFCKGELPKKAEQLLLKIKQNALRQLRIINNVLDISRCNVGIVTIKKLNADLVHVTGAIVDSVIEYARQKGVNLHFETNLSELMVCIDVEKYECILLNLLSNAIKFTPNGKNVKVCLCSRNGKIHLSVEDEGIGISKTNQKRIFERFVQISSPLGGNTEGVGLGLTLVKSLAEAMEGKVTVKSLIGEGSVFKVTLPLCPAISVDESCPGEKPKAFELDNEKLIESISAEFSDICT
jgi:signal transduction histidine kinase